MADVDVLLRFCISFTSNYGCLAIISPTIILYLILKVTGIPMTEEQSIRAQKGMHLKSISKKQMFLFPGLKKDYR